MKNKMVHPLVSLIGWHNHWVCVEPLRHPEKVLKTLSSNPKSFNLLENNIYIYIEKNFNLYQIGEKNWTIGLVGWSFNLNSLNYLKLHFLKIN